MERSLGKVLQALRQAGLTAKPSKCVWGAKSLTYLGHTVGYGLVQVPEARVLALKNFRFPVNKKQLRSFLGTAGYYRRFIPGFSGRAGVGTEPHIEKKNKNLLEEDRVHELLIN